MTKRPSNSKAPSSGSAQARLARKAKRSEFAGVQIVAPKSTYVEPGVRVGRGTVIHPNTTISGKTTIGARCRIGPNTIIADSRIGDEVSIFASVVEGAEIESGADVGPFSHLRPGVHLEKDVHIGNFVEVKASRIGASSRAGHFCYIGDAKVGANVNIGAGTVTCNYDGENKNQTVIEDGAFIGSDTMLVAPIRVGRRAATGAGSVVTKDVPDDVKVVGVPARAAPVISAAGPPKLLRSARNGPESRSGSAKRGTSTKPRKSQKPPVRQVRRTRG
jgi:bifunctional UDP-N-acetylglucosamine pyrophosphorylase / glucosamine-1-phosphate N-acetyltransferase